MARGFPSMTALLGLLAVAGYQNRDKLGELLGGAMSKPGSGAQQPPGLGGVLGNLGGMLGGAGAGGLLTGGLGELLEKFTQSGQADTAKSWIDKGPNKAISEPELKSAIGSDVLTALEQQTGLVGGYLPSKFAQSPAALARQREDQRPQVQAIQGGQGTAKIFSLGGGNIELADLGHRRKALEEGGAGGGNLRDHLAVASHEPL